MPSQQQADHDREAEDQHRVLVQQTRTGDSAKRQPERPGAFADHGKFHSP